MKDEKPKCFTEEEIRKIKELGKDAVRHTLCEEDYLGIKEVKNQVQEDVE